MTTTPADPELLAACDQLGISPDGATPLRQHATDVWLVPHERAVARIGRSPKAAARARTAVRLTSWLASQGVPVTEPATDKVVELPGGATVTLWVHYPQNGAPPPPAGHLGAILRHLHDLPAPPVELPCYEPLTHLAAVVEGGATSLDNDERMWLAAQRERLVQRYHRLDSWLGVGACHGDAYPGNTLWDGNRALLGDWDEAATALRELDLVNTHQGGIRFGRSEQELQAFSAAYGCDVREWDGFSTLQEMRDLHTLASYIQLADAGDERAGDEVRHRIGTLRRGDLRARWNAR